MQGSDLVLRDEEGPGGRAQGASPPACELPSRGGRPPEAVGSPHCRQDPSPFSDQGSSPHFPSEGPRGTQVWVMRPQCLRSPALPAASHGGYQAVVSASSRLRSLERFRRAGGLGAQAPPGGLSPPAPGLPALPSLFCASPGGPLARPAPRPTEHLPRRPGLSLRAPRTPRPGLGTHRAGRSSTTRPSSPSQTPRRAAARAVGWEGRRRSQGGRGRGRGAGAGGVGHSCAGVRRLGPERTYLRARARCLLFSGPGGGVGEGCSHSSQKTHKWPDARGPEHCAGNASKADGRAVAELPFAERGRGGEGFGQGSSRAELLALSTGGVGWWLGWWRGLWFLGSGVGRSCYQPEKPLQAVDPPPLGAGPPSMRPPPRPGPSAQDRPSLLLLAGLQLGLRSQGQPALTLWQNAEACPVSRWPFSALPVSAYSPAVCGRPAPDSQAAGLACSRGTSGGWLLWPPTPLPSESPAVCPAATPWPLLSTQASPSDRGPRPRCQNPQQSRGPGQRLQS